MTGTSSTATGPARAVAAPVPLPPGGAKALAMWLVAIVAYVIAVFHRASLGVAGVAAAQRLGVGASLLAMLSVAQLVVYAGMQVPAGVLLDRFGPRRLLATGAVLMAGGQLAFALAHQLPLAIAARAVLGVGDALTFISVLRVIAAWYPPRRNAVIVQLTGTLGQIGSIASAVPLLAVLHHAGWTATFLGAAGLGALAFVAVLLGLREAPAGAPVRQLPEPGEALVTLREAWAEPGTRLGLWTHFVTQFSGCVFAMLWGYPFLVQGEGLAPGRAALLLTLLTVAAMVVGPLIGQFCGRRPYHRSNLVIGIVASSAAAWTVVLAWPGRAPMWLLVGLILVLGLNGPGSVMGFDYARSFNPDRRLGSATGIVNVGGFAASVVLIVAVGVVLDALTPAGAAHPPLSAFRVAFALQYVFWAVGLVLVVRYRRLARRQLAAAGVPAGMPAQATSGGISHERRAPRSRSRRAPAIRFTASASSGSGRVNGSRRKRSSVPSTPKRGPGATRIP
jgi:MFS family permease